ncbi:unknown [Collinsella sp. CAG:398]|nr:unknown [Collinsella sp. CAG:398]
MAVIMTRRPCLMIVVATAVFALAQAMDMVCAFPRLRELVDHILLDRGIARHGSRPQHTAAHSGMGPRIATKRTQRGVDSEADHRGNRRLRQKHLCQKARIHALGHEQGQHLIGSREEHRHKRAQRDDASRIERRPHGGEAALRHDAEKRAHHRPRRTSALDDAIHPIARCVFQELERQIGNEQERHDGERILQRVRHDMFKQFHRERSPNVKRGRRTQSIIVARTARLPSEKRSCERFIPFAPTP